MSYKNNNINVVYNFIVTNGKLLAETQFSKIYLIKRHVAKVLLMKTDEYAVTKHLRHRNILIPRDIIYGTAGNDIIFYPWMKGGSLRKWLRSRLCLTEVQIRKLFTQMISAVDYCHTLKIIHRDIKLDNFLISLGWRVKLGDFGMATYHHGAGLDLQCGTPLYIAPEVLIGPTYTFSADIWSLGICLYEIIYGKQPYKGVKNIEDLANIIQNTIYLPKALVSPELTDLLSKMLIVDPTKRIDIIGIKKTPLDQIKRSRTIKKIYVYRSAKLLHSDNIAKV